MRGSEQVTQQWERTLQGRTLTGAWQKFGRMMLAKGMKHDQQDKRSVHSSTDDRLNRSRSSIRTLGNYKQVIGKQA